MSGANNAARVSEVPRTPPGMVEAYNREEGKLIDLIRWKARRFARAVPPTFADYDDLVQEGRMALLAALGSYDPEKGKLSSYLSRIIDNTFLLIMGAALSRRRLPRLWERAPGGEWVEERAPACGLDMVPESAAPASSDVDPEGAILDAERANIVSSFQMSLLAELDGAPRTVLELRINPPIELLIMIRNKTGGYGDVGLVHIAEYTGMTKNQVDYAWDKVRKQARNLAKESSLAADLM